MSARVAIIIPVHNQPQHFLPCLKSALQWTPPEAATIVVADDASAPESRDLLRDQAARHPRLQLLRSDENLGFLRTCNNAIRATTGEYVLLLNSDTAVSPGWLEAMVRAADSDPRIAMVNPLTNFGTTFALPIASGANYLMMGARLRRAPARYVDVVPTTGFCLLLRRSRLEEMGLLDEAYGPGWYEDQDLYMEVIDRGWRAVATTDAYVFHRGEASFDRTRGKAILDQNRALFDSRWGNRFYTMLAHQDSHPPFADLAAMFRPPRPSLSMLLRRHLPLALQGHPGRAWLRIRLGWMTAAPLPYAPGSFLNRLARPGIPTIAFVLEQITPGDASATSVLQLANALALRDVDTHLLTWGDVDPAMLADSFAAPAIYPSREQLELELPAADFICQVRTEGVVPTELLHSLNEGEGPLGRKGLAALSAELDDALGPMRRRSGRRRTANEVPS